LLLPFGEGGVVVAELFPRDMSKTAPLARATSKKLAFHLARQKFFPSEVHI